MKKHLLKSLILTVLTMQNFANANPTGKVSCNGVEINSDGSLNKEAFLSLMGPNGVELRKRTISIEEYLRKPHAEDANRYSLASSLFKILSYHAEAELADIPGITKDVVVTKSKFRGHDYYAQSARMDESYSVYIKGDHGSKLTCTSYLSKSDKSNSWIDMANGYILNPEGMTSYSCEIQGQLKDISQRLFSVLKETANSNLISQILMDRRTKEVGYEQAYTEKIERDKQYKEFYLPLKSGSRGSRGVDLAAVNKTIVNPNDYSTRPSMDSLTALNAKAFVISSAAWTCDALLVCEQSQCSFMDLQQYGQLEQTLSVAE